MKTELLKSSVILCFTSIKLSRFTNCLIRLPANSGYMPIRPCPISPSQFVLPDTSFPIRPAWFVFADSSFPIHVWGLIVKTFITKCLSILIVKLKWLTMILKIFMKLILNCHHTLWHHFMADFELVVKSSLQYIFSDILQWHGCYPHFGQAIQRKIQSIGLITEYRDRASLFSIFVRK